MLRLIKNLGSMASVKRRDYETRFKQAGEKPLDKKALSVRVPEEIAQAVRALPDSQRSEWLRSVISEAVQRELIQGKRITYSESESPA